jgi:predicted lipid-binding transport protein (Tim44 family)
MQKWLVGATIGLIAATFTLDAEAQRRLGSGKVFGKQSPQVQQRQATPAPQSPQAPAPTQQAPAATAAAGAAAPAAAAARAASPIRGALVGLAAGLGLVALASWLGFGETLATILLFVMFAMLVAAAFGMLRRDRGGPRPAYGAAGRGSVREATLGYEAQPSPRPPTWQRPTMPSPTAARPGSAMAEFARAQPHSLDAAWGIPADFDVAGFLGNAKAYFTRLQSAWDRGSFDELSEFTTDDMFIALTHELRAQPRDGARTAVQTVEATLLGIESGPTEHLASVRFSGTLQVGTDVEAFDEVWNLSKSTDGKSGWLLAGIQQLS